MPVMTAPGLSMSDAERAEPCVMSTSTSLPHRSVVQAEALFMAADGVANEEIARRCWTTPDTVRRWRNRFDEQGVDGAGRIAAGRGRRSRLPEGTVAAVVHDTLYDAHRSNAATDILRFSKLIDLHVTKDLEVHVVLDDLSAHKAPVVRDWLADPRRARWHVHFTPTSSSWLDLVEGWFAELTERRLKRGAFSSVAQLVEAIELWAEPWSDNPKPLIWQTLAQDIIKRVRSGRRPFQQVKSATDH